MHITLGQMGSEFRQSLRRLLRSPGFAAAATLPLPVGIAAATTVFTVVNDVVLAPLPYPEADRLVVIRDTLPGYEIDGRIPETGVLMGQYLHYRERSRSLEELGGYWTFDAPLSGDDGAKYLPLGGATPGLWRVLGIRPVRFDNLRREPASLVYAPVLITDQPNDIGMASFVLRTSLLPATLIDAVRQTVVELRPDIPLAFPETMEVFVAHETATIRFSSLLVLLAACATVLLSVLGVYSVLAYVVGLRRSEFGVRLAIGASGAQLSQMVLVQGMITAGAGAVLGLVAAAAASRLMRSFLFGVTPVDPATFGLAAAILLVAAAAATWLPARRTARVHPAEALRS